jgi:hypothetical protein
MRRTQPRTYALPYPAVFDAVVAVLGERKPVTSASRDRGRVASEGRLRRTIAYLGADGTTRTTVVIDVDGAISRRGDGERILAALDSYLGYYYRPAAQPEG